jgi:hypothetical protein
MKKIDLGRYVFGLAAVLFGLITLVWHDFNGWQQIRPLGSIPHREGLAYLAARSKSSEASRFNGVERRRWEPSH